MKFSTVFFCALALCAAFVSVPAQVPNPTSRSVVFVSDRFEANNWDIYYMPDVNAPTTVFRLTSHSEIDNHPDLYLATPPESSKIVWSSNRDGDFEIYVGSLFNMEGTLRQLTFNNIPDRHPHFSHDGQRVVFSAKYRLVSTPLDTIRSECSVPVPPPYWYEGLCVYTLASGRLDSLDIRNADPGGRLWPNTFETWVGHPSFSPDGTKILFSAAIDVEGKDWEVYSMDYVPPATISNLRRHTSGTLYPENPNPIKMSAGAHYSADGKKIYYSSTRTSLGNSQLFRIDATAQNVPASAANRLTSHYGNDYVPEPMEDGRVLFVSDLGPNICAPPDSGASNDLDVFIMDSLGGSRRNLTDNEINDEMLLIGDEVSWFCGIKPNLSECTNYPRYWNICWFKIFYQMGHDPQYLPNFSNRNLYTRAWNKFTSYMQTFNPTEFQRIIMAVDHYWRACETTAWQNIPSWWVIPSIFGRYPDLEMESIVVPAPRSRHPVGTLFRPQVRVRNNGSTPDTGTVVVRIRDASGRVIYADSVLRSIPIDILTLELSPTQRITVPGRYRVNAEIEFPDDMVLKNNSLESFFDVFDPVYVEEEKIEELPLTFALRGNYPNPFNPTTTIKYDLPVVSRITLKIFNLLGQEVRTLVDEVQDAGYKSLTWDGLNSEGRSMASGVYFCRMEALSLTDPRHVFLEVRKMLLLR